MAGTKSEQVRAEVRLGKPSSAYAEHGARCGNRAPDGTHWCHAWLGDAFRFYEPIPPCYEYPSPATAPERERNVQRARDGGLEVVWKGYRSMPDGYDGPVENGFVAEPFVVRRHLRLPDGWTWHGWYWGVGLRAAERRRTDNPPLVRDRGSEERRGFRCLTPDYYPIVVECPDCELKQWLGPELRGKSGRVRLHPYADDSDLPWRRQDYPKEYPVVIDRPTREGGRVDPEWAARVCRRFPAAPATDGPPERVALFALAQHTADCTTVYSEDWQRLGDWARTAPVEECRRVLDEATAVVDDDGDVVVPTIFARRWRQLRESELA